jgi:hypothetical protein
LVSKAKVSLVCYGGASPPITPTPALGNTSYPAQKEREMSEKRQVNAPPARLERLVGLLAFVILMAVICLLSPGSPLRAAPKPALRWPH